MMTNVDFVVLVFFKGQWSHFRKVPQSCSSSLRSVLFFHSFFAGNKLLCVFLFLVWNGLHVTIPLFVYIKTERAEWN